MLVAWSDAEAYADWAAKALPTEAEFEYVARGGLEGSDYAWGDELAPGRQMMANYWQGPFPFSNTRPDGWERTSPVRSFPLNGYGLFDMIADTWEWTADWRSERPQTLAKMRGDACCTLDKPRGGKLPASFDPAQPQVRIGRRSGSAAWCSRADRTSARKTIASAIAPSRGIPK